MWTLLLHDDDAVHLQKISSISSSKNRRWKVASEASGKSFHLFFRSSRPVHPSKKRERYVASGFR